MTKGDNRPPSPDHPQVRLLGDVDDRMVRDFFADLEKTEQEDDGDIVLELTTIGGDAEMARRLVLEIELARKRLCGRRLMFLGKTQVYSAGASIMSAFPREDRFLTKDTVLMVHCRQLEKSVEISGPMRGSLPEVAALEHQLKVGIDIEQENFRRLIEGSDVTLDEIFERALYNWYLKADEALDRGLIAAVL